MEEMLRSEKLEFAYAVEDEENAQSPVPALRGVDVKVSPGEFVVILGHNGCGKSTLARHINALLQPSAGTLWVKGMDTKQEDMIWLIRQNDFSKSG